MTPDGDRRRGSSGEPFILGLTGSIGMGKSTAAGMFADFGIPVHDADAAVHALYASDRNLAGAVAAEFPGILSEAGLIDRDRLRHAVGLHPDGFAKLEAIVHPRVLRHREEFLSRHGQARLVVLDVPLLFETGAQADCDGVLVVTAPADVQRRRVLARPGMSAFRLDHILARQVPDAEKRRRADHVIDTSSGLSSTREAVAALVSRLTGAAIT